MRSSTGHNFTAAQYAYALGVTTFSSIIVTMTISHPDVQKFADTLRDLEELLDAHSAEFWAKKVQRSRKAAEQSDGWCVGNALSWYGGMGSLNDLVLVAPNEANDRLGWLKSEVYRQAKALQKF